MLEWEPVIVITTIREGWAVCSKCVDYCLVVINKQLSDIGVRTPSKEVCQDRLAHMLRGAKVPPNRKHLSSAEQALYTAMDADLGLVSPYYWRDTGMQDLVLSHENFAKPELLDTEDGYERMRVAFLVACHNAEVTRSTAELGLGMTTLGHHRRRLVGVLTVSTALITFPNPPDLDQEDRIEVVEGGFMEMVCF